MSDPALTPEQLAQLSTAARVGREVAALRRMRAFHLPPVPERADGIPFYTWAPHCSDRLQWVVDERYQVVFCRSDLRLIQRTGQFYTGTAPAGRFLLDNRDYGFQVGTYLIDGPGDIVVEPIAFEQIPDRMPEELHRQLLAGAK